MSLMLIKPQDPKTKRTESSRYGEVGLRRVERGLKKQERVLFRLFRITKIGSVTED